MALRAPTILPTNSRSAGEPGRVSADRASDSIRRLLSSLTQVITALNELDGRLLALETAPTSTDTTAVPATWYTVTSAPTVTLNIANGARQYLVPGHNMLLKLATGYTGNDTLTVLIRFGTTAYDIQLDTTFQIDSNSYVIEPRPDTYSILRLEFRTGLPYVAHFLTGAANPV
jgi:hypothetical protein